MKVLDRLEVLAGISTNSYEETARGISDGTWDGMKVSERKKYVKDHPTSRFAKDPKYGFAKPKEFPAGKYPVKNKMLSEEDKQILKIGKYPVATPDDVDALLDYPFNKRPDMLKKVFRNGYKSDSVKGFIDDYVKHAPIDLLLWDGLMYALPSQDRLRAQQEAVRSPQLEQGIIDLIHEADEKGLKRMQDYAKSYPEVGNTIRKAVTFWVNKYKNIAQITKRRNEDGTSYYNIFLDFDNPKKYAKRKWSSQELKSANVVNRILGKRTINLSGAV